MEKRLSRKKPKIIVPHGKKMMMRKALGVSTETIRRALNFQTESEEADRIRREAIENYGGSLVEITVTV